MMHEKIGQEDEKRNTLRAKVANVITNRTFMRERMNNVDRMFKDFAEETTMFLRQNKHIDIAQSDKEKKTNIMERKQYNEKGEQLLEDGNTYRELSEDPTEKLQKNLNNLIAGCPSTQSALSPQTVVVLSTDRLWTRCGLC